MKSLKLYLAGAGILLIIYIVAMFNRPKAIDWSETLNAKDKIPFGTYILNNRLKDIFPHSKITPYRQPIYNVIAEDSVKNASYIIICGGIELTKADYTQLIKYIKTGNNVFVAAENFGRAFDKYLDIKTATNFNLRDDVTPINFTNPALNPTRHYTIDKGTGSVYFSKFDTLRASVIGENSNHKANFLKFTIGKGSLYLVANPKVFSNYSLLKHDGAEYAATTLSYLKGTDKLIMDEYYTQGESGEESPVRLFLSTPTLQWAYYITIFSLLFFVLFEMKRRQRIIPVIEPLSNSTLEFVTVVGQVYYEKRDNVNIAHKKILYLLTYLRDEYQLKTGKLDNEFIEKLTSKIGLENSFAAELVNFLKYISVQPAVSDRELIELNKLIEQFYSKSR